jgi:pimeloyl-ACP methyl ester carboxylesterase
MNNSTLVEITTKDNLIHQGIYAEPVKISGTALLWIHGLSSNFYSHSALMNMMISLCGEKGYGFASFNNRGHDTVCGIKKIDPTNENTLSRIVGGAGNERFEECVYDIDAGITFLIQKGYKKIFLVGSSTGANKACYYAGTQHDPRVSGVVLASAVCDHLVPSLRVSWVTVFILKIFQAIGLGNMLITFVGSYPVTPNRALSLLTPHSAEDVFDYDDVDCGLKVFGNITNPLCVILGEQDDSVDRPAFVIKTAYDKKAHAKHYASIIIKDADHGFKGKEKEFGKEILKFIETIK